MKNRDNVKEGSNPADSDLVKMYSVEDPPDGGIRAWLVVASCSAINLLIGILEPGVRLALLRSKDDTGINEETLVEMYNIYNSLAGVYAPIASVSMLVLGYKWTVHIGSWCLAVSFIILSFVKNVHAIKFLLYVMTGIGSSLVQLGSLIPILEYFTSKRILALMITKVCRYCGQFITLSIVLSGEKTTWQSLYRICMGVSIPIGVIGLTIPTLLSNLKTTSTPFIERVHNYLKVFKNILLWIVCTLFFIYQIGVVPPQVEVLDVRMSERLGIESEVKTTVYSLSSGIGLMIGAVLGWLFKFSVNRKFYSCVKQKPTTKEMFHIVMVLMVGIPVVMAIMCFIAPESPNFPYFFIFVILFFAHLAFIEELRDDMLPDVFGQVNVKLVEGLIQMFVGIGGVISSESAAELQWKNSFRMGGGLLLVSSAVAIGILLLKLSGAICVMKVTPINLENTENSCQGTGRSSCLSQSETSDENITQSTVQATMAAQISTPDVLQAFNFKYKSKTSYGPSNMKFVIPRKNNMYGSRETSVTSSNGSVESVSTDTSDLKHKLTHATGRTLYTDLQASRSPDSYRMVPSDRNMRIEGGNIKPSQYNMIYSYNITHSTEGDMNNIDLL